MATITIERRFCGPPDSGNGGFVSGALAAFVDGVAEVRLLAPPPLDLPLEVRPLADATELHGPSGPVARAVATTLDIDPPSPRSFAQASEDAQFFVSPEQHLIPGCFTCGSTRKDGDGLRIFAGSASDGGLVSAPWIPHASLAPASGRVPDAVVWAALDCPGYFAHPGNRPALLGTMAAEVREPVLVGRRYVVVGAALGEDGRKRHSSTALFDEDGRVCAISRQVWIGMSS